MRIKGQSWALGKQPAGERSWCVGEWAALTECRPPWWQVLNGGVQYRQTPSTTWLGRDVLWGQVEWRSFDHLIV